MSELNEEVHHLNYYLIDTSLRNFERRKSIEHMFLRIPSNLVQQCDFNKPVKLSN